MSYLERYGPAGLAQAGGSCRPIPIAAAAFGASEPDEGIDGGTGVGVWVEPDPAGGADAAPVAGEKGAAEEVGPDGEAVVAPLVPLGADADQGSLLREQRELDRGDWARAGLRALQERDAAIERWLREEVAPTCDAMQADPSRAIPAIRVLQNLRSHHAKRLKARRGV